MKYRFEPYAVGEVCTGMNVQEFTDKRFPRKRSASYGDPTHRTADKSIVDVRTIYYNAIMNCPTCNKPMRKVRGEITNNFKVLADFKEYDKLTYECKDDDIWVSTEIPLTAKPATKSSK